MDVMLYEVFAEEEAALRRYLPGDVTATYTPQTVQAHRQATGGARPARLISTRTQSVVPVAWAADVAGILTRSAGYDHLAAYQRRVARAIPCGYLPLYCARAVAEQTVLMILALARRLPRQMRQFTSFHRDDLTGVECAGRTLLVVGVGNLGSEVASLGQALGMRVFGVDVVRRVPSLSYVELDAGLARADVIVSALPLTERTRGLLGYERLRRAKPGAILVNISRGEITPAADLKRLLEERILGGLGLDVFEDEPVLAEWLRAKSGPAPASIQPILELQRDDRVLLTPHNAFNTEEAVERKAQQSAEAIVAFLKTGAFPSPVPSEPA